MLRPRFIPLVFKQVVRQRTRSLLTALSIALAMFLFSTVQALQLGAKAATEKSAGDNTLVVYRKYRFCPFTSRLPESYAERIRKLPGVSSAVPMKIAVSNCRTSLDVVTFRGVPAEAFIEEYGPRIRVVSGSLEAWQRRSDAALLGETLAKRRRLGVGDSFDAAGITVTVAGIIHSDEPQHQNVAYVHLDFLQYASGSRRGGWVTQFNIRVTDPSRLDAVAAAVDAEFAADQEPTHTRSEKAFVAQAASDVIEIVRFTRWLGWGCVAAVLGLVGNAIVMAVQQRIREHAVLQTLGYSGHLIARLILGEGLVLSMAGALAGTAAAVGLMKWGQYSLSVEGLSVPIQADWQVLAWGVVSAVLLGVMAGLVPAWIASRRSIVDCFRAV
ncbi:MAG: hypothetical protein AMXMBFR13_09030 [Phycisphaerae bacterium]